MDAHQAETARTVRTQIVARPEPGANFPNTVAETRYPGPATEAALMLWFKTFFEAVGLPKLNGVANRRRFLRASALPFHQGSGYRSD
jgi:hypothetical protein